MIDTASIVIAVISLLGSLAAACFTGWISFYIDQIRRRAEAKALIHKYRDPLMLAAYDLQSRLFGLVQQNLLRYHDDEEKHELLYVYTMFLVGQYFSWTYILRRQAQFLRFSTDKTNKKLNVILDTITNEFSLDSRPEEKPFMLWRGQQMALGETMTLEEEKGQLYCMGFAAFAHKYHNDEEFRKWFRPVEVSITTLVGAQKSESKLATFRLRRLQHLFIDLILLLDQDRVATALHQYKRMKVDAAHECRCDNCPGVEEPRTVSKLPEP